VQQLLTLLTTRFASVVDSIPGVYVPQSDLENDINSTALKIVLYSTVGLIILTIAAAFLKDRVPRLKAPLFALIVLIMAGSTLTMIGSTVYLNVKSESGGPIHWHADFEVWACGNELELRDPTATFSNKIGTSTLHEHNDHRVHLEGVAVDKENDASLGKFFNVIGGAITDTAMVVPLNEDTNMTFEDEFDGDGPATTNPQFVSDYILNDGENGRVAYFQDGQTCGSEDAEVQVFAYRLDEATNTYMQTKVEDPKSYVIKEDPNVPPGDCIIFEFDVTKDKTDKLCEQYGIRDVDRCDEFGVKEEQHKICTLKQVDYDASYDYRRPIQVDSTYPANETSPTGSDAPNDTIIDNEEVEL
jgi:hypothetical protein